MIPVQYGAHDHSWQLTLNDIRSLPELECDYCSQGAAKVASLHGCQEAFMCPMHWEALMNDYVNRLIANGFLLCMHCGKVFGGMEWFVSVRDV